MGERAANEESSQIASGMTCAIMEFWQPSQQPN
jgi:hypothetical protein